MTVQAQSIVEHKETKQGLQITRHFTKADQLSPLEQTVWDRRDAIILGEDGEPVFEQRDVEVPQAWSQLATNVVVSKYFRGQLGTDKRETSVRQVIGRVADTITGWGAYDGYFHDQDSMEAFRDELTHLLVEQKLAFNSPVWFNVGIKDKPQCSACFILSVDDNMESILDWYRQEGMIFKGGSGSGANLSNIRSSKEPLSVGGIASGPVSFMKAADASAGVIKSAGATRRAAKMCVLNVDHPDILDFIRCKVEEERKAHTLIDAGYNAGIDGAAYASIYFQNANNSVRVPDAFMSAVVDKRFWSTRLVTTGEDHETFEAKDLLNEIAEATWECGDPGLQFDTTINDWHTCPVTGRINASNPCSEYVHLDDSACNLASLNLMKFRTKDGDFDTESFQRAVDISILAQDIIVQNSSYPTEKITENAHRFRELGLGYANLGALLMSLGLPYDSDAGRNYAAAITAVMTGQAYLQSANIAKYLGAFDGYQENEDAMLRVMEKHHTATYDIASSLVPMSLVSAARSVWANAVSCGRSVGYRNSQATVLAPTGTIAFMMDCDTTGVEPDLALVKYKRLVGGGMLKLVNTSVPCALERLGYDGRQIHDIIEYIDLQDTIEGAPVKDEHLSIFDCAFKPEKGNRFIDHMGHIKMMGAVQPFISGAISKTVNLPNDATVADIADAYMEAWRHGVKAIAIYRDGCKRVQPLATAKSGASDNKPTEPKELDHVLQEAERQAVRRRLPTDRRAVCHKFEIAGHEGYLHVGFYDDGTPGEIFIRMAKEGSTISGLMDSVATVTSMALQYGVPIEALVKKFSHVRFEPSGFTKNQDIPYAKSLIDYTFRYLDGLTLPGTSSKSGSENRRTKEEMEPVAAQVGGQAQADAPSCAECGAIMVRNGTCYKCVNCGSTSGCS